MKLTSFLDAVKNTQPYLHLSQGNYYNYINIGYLVHAQDKCNYDMDPFQQSLASIPNKDLQQNDTKEHNYRISYLHGQNLLLLVRENIPENEKKNVTIV